MTGEFEYPTSSQPVLGCLDSYGKKSWILVDFLVDPIVCIHVHVCHTHMSRVYVCMLCITRTCIRDVHNSIYSKIVNNYNLTIHQVLSLIDEKHDACGKLFSDPIAHHGSVQW